jgi:[ribosomal protein S5]-alanine N-acetyltransferase
MQFSVLPQSSNELIALRPIMAADVSAWFAYLSDRSVVQHTSWNLQSPSDLMPYVWGAEPATPSSRLRLAVVMRSTDELVGTAGFHTVSPENRSAEIAYDLSPTVWGKGLATYACGLLAHWGHDHVGLVRVQATVLESNERSAKVLQRCGFRCEGLLESYRFVRGKPGNFYMYAHVAGHADGT